MLVTCSAKDSGALEACLAHLKLQTGIQGAKLHVVMYGHDDDRVVAMGEATRVAGVHGATKLWHSPGACADPTVSNARAAALNALVADLDLRDDVWVAALDAGDRWHPHKLEAQMHEASKVRGLPEKGGPYTVVGVPAPGYAAGPLSAVSFGEFVTEGTCPVVPASLVVRAGDAWWDPSTPDGTEDQDLCVRLSVLERRFVTVGSSGWVTARRAWLPGGDPPYKWVDPCWEPAVAVVSVFVPIPSKKSVDTYMEWMANFLGRHCCKLIMFAPESVIPKLARMREWLPRDWTHFVPLEFGDMRATREYAHHFRVREALPVEDGNPPPKITWQLMCVWAEKMELMRRALELNPFGSTVLAWMDAGYVRATGPVAQVPDARKLAASNPTRLHMGVFETVEWQFEETTGLHQAQLEWGTACRAAGFFFCGKDVLVAVCRAFYDTLDLFLENNLPAAGRDELIHEASAVRFPGMYASVPIDDWFWALKSFNGGSCAAACGEPPTILVPYKPKRSGVSGGLAWAGIGIAAAAFLAVVVVIILAACGTFSRKWKARRLPNRGYR